MLVGVQVYSVRDDAKADLRGTLEKIKKITGLDLREFDHAIVFKIALMVNKYLRANPIKY